MLLIRRIRELLYEQGFTISGARNKLDSRGASHAIADELPAMPAVPQEAPLDRVWIRNELMAILTLLK
ncbi:hypothetical protein D3C81_2038670 [compost metagenome]